MKFLIIGLGNIGAEYADTRHNVGFAVLNALAAEKGATFRTDRYGDVCEISHKGRKLILVKPSTYMNLSGNAVRYWMQKEGVEIENLLVISDDIALPFGTLRIRKQGSDGGHNGLSHIITTLGKETFSRVRFGIGGDFPKGHQVDYVLGKWSAPELEALPLLLGQVGKAIISFATIGIDRTMNEFNKRV